MWVSIANIGKIHHFGCRMTAMSVSVPDFPPRFSVMLLLTSPKLSAFSCSGTSSFFPVHSCYKVFVKIATVPNIQKDGVPDREYRLFIFVDR